MLIREANYEGSFPKFKTLPSPRLPEYCFWGRSNVGKSSIINFICNRKDLALISGNPGKTINFNFFNIDNTFHIVDLPGYGYARVSKKMRGVWSVEIDKYLLERVNLVSVFLLIDISIPIQEIDLEKIDMLGEHNVPFVLLLTKTDKCKKIELKHNVQKFTIKLNEKWDALPPIILTSVEKRIGKEEIIDYIFLHLKSVEINQNN